MGRCPLAAYEVAGAEALGLSFAVGLGEVGFVPQFGEVDRASAGVRPLEEVGIGVQRSAFLAQLDVAQESLLVRHEAVDDGEPFRGPHHGAHFLHLLQLFLFRRGGLPSAFQPLDVLVEQFFRLVELVLVDVVLGCGLGVPLRFGGERQAQGAQGRNQVFLDMHCVFSFVYPKVGIIFRIHMVSP